MIGLVKSAAGNNDELSFLFCFAWAAPRVTLCPSIPQFLLFRHTHSSTHMLFPASRESALPPTDYRLLVHDVVLCEAPYLAIATSNLAF